MTTAEHTIHPIGTDDHKHSSNLAHHFDSLPQQHEAAKLGIWLFLATEILLFGGLFCVYAVYRSNHPELFSWGSQFLDIRLGAANTVILIASSVTMAMAVTFVQLGRRWPAIIALSITFVCGVLFMAIKSVEYEHKIHENQIWGTGFYVTPEHEQGITAATGDSGLANYAGNVAQGQKLWNATCRSCHGVAGEGVTGQGKDIRTSEFIYQRDDLMLLEFIKQGRAANDPLNLTGVQMPSKGGNPLLKDTDLLDIVAYLRGLMTPVEPDETEEAPVEENANGIVEHDVASNDGGSASEAEVVAQETPTPIEQVVADVEPEVVEFWIPRSSIPLAPSGPSGVNQTALAAIEGVTMNAPQPAAKSHLHHTVDPQRPTDAHLFFGIYFMMTGLHGLHVLVGMGIIAWLLMRTIRGDFGKSYFTPVDLGGLYWHIVDLIWIFLFPLLYLIHS